MYIPSLNVLNQHGHWLRSMCTCTYSQATGIANEVHTNVKRKFTVTKDNHSSKRNDNIINVYSLHGLSLNLLIQLFFCQKRFVVSIIHIYLYSFFPNCPLTNVRSRFSADEQHMYPRTICSSSALKRLPTIVRGQFGR